MAVEPHLLPTYSEAIFNAMQAERTVTRIAFNPSTANPGDVLYVTVPKHDQDVVIVPGSLSLLFDIDLTGGHENNFLVYNVSRVLVSRLTVTFGGTPVQDTNGYDIYKIFDDMFLDDWVRDEMVMEGIQHDDFNKICCNAGDKKTSGVDAENKLAAVYKQKYKINLDHQILTSNGVFYPQALDKDLTFELTLPPASQVVRGSDPNKLVYKLKNIQLEYERIRSKQLADHATTVYTNGKGFAYDEVVLEKTITFDRGTDADLNLLVNPQRQSLKGILCIFILPYTAGTRDTENFFNPDITNAEITINGIPNRVYNNGIQPYDMWREISRLFCEKYKKRSSCGNNFSPYMSKDMYYAKKMFGFFLDLRSMASTNMHGSGQRLVNSENGVQIALTRTTSGSRNVRCHIFSISDAQLNIMDRQLLDIQSSRYMGILGQPQINKKYAPNELNKNFHFCPQFTTNSNNLSAAKIGSEIMPALNLTAETSLSFLEKGRESFFEFVKFVGSVFFVDLRLSQEPHIPTTDAQFSVNHFLKFATSKNEVANFKIYSPLFPRKIFPFGAH